MSSKLPKKVMDSAISMYLQHDMAVKDIAELHEIGQNVIYEELKRRGIKANRPRRVRSVDAPPRRNISSEEAAKMREMHKAGMSAPVIATILKTSTTSVRKHWGDEVSSAPVKPPVPVQRSKAVPELPITMVEPPRQGLLKRLSTWLFG